MSLFSQACFQLDYFLLQSFGQTRKAYLWTNAL